MGRLVEHQRVRQPAHFAQDILALSRLGGKKSVKQEMRIGQARCRERGNGGTRPRQGNDTMSGGTHPRHESRTGIGNGGSTGIGDQRD